MHEKNAAPHCSAKHRHNWRQASLTNPPTPPSTPPPLPPQAYLKATAGQRPGERDGKADAFFLNAAKALARRGFVPRPLAARCAAEVPEDDFRADARR